MRHCCLHIKYAYTSVFDSVFSTVPLLSIKRELREISVMAFVNFMHQNTVFYGGKAYLNIMALEGFVSLSDFICFIVWVFFNYKKNCSKVSTPTGQFVQGLEYLECCFCRHVLAY